MLETPDSSHLNYPCQDYTKQITPPEGSSLIHLIFINR